MSAPRETVTVLGIPAVIRSQAMVAVMELAQRVALTDAAILITGESGSGKELVARAIHQHSLRCAKPWVDVNCAALPEHLIESELFGYEKGAFSGADTSKQELFEMAHQGTLFLDEIGDLDLKMQVKLFRVLDGVPYYRLGGSRKVSVDVRVVTATNQDLTEAIERGTFRKDLFHRLDQVHIVVPPLRERKEDIAPLAEFFLLQQNPHTQLTQEALRALQGYSWPGNVRELRNVVLKANILAKGPEICARDLPLNLCSVPTASPSLPLTSLETMEKEMILQALSVTGGRQQEAAKLLGISRQTLHRKLKAYQKDKEHEAKVLATV